MQKSHYRFPDNGFAYSQQFKRVGYIDE